LALEAVQSLHTGEVESFMIGLGEDLNSSDPELLNNMALAGGRPRIGDTKYYMANNLEELQFAVTEIEQIAIKCNLTLDQAPGQVANLWVLFDGNLVAMDPQRNEGWDYDQTRKQLLFYGSACQRLRSGEVSQIGVKEGCLPP
jgi:hypothetical protein